MTVGKIPRSGEFKNGKFWFERQASIITVGLTSVAVQEVGDVDTLDLPSEGEEIIKGQVLGVVEGSTGSIEISAPVKGQVTEVNENAVSNPIVCNEDPFEEGWLYRLSVSDLDDLLNEPL